jgi:hypothetical protein
MHCDMGSAVMNYRWRYAHSLWAYNGDVELDVMAQLRPRPDGYTIEWWEGPNCGKPANRYDMPGATLDEAKAMAVALVRLG